MSNPIYFENTVRGSETLDLQECVLQYQVSGNEHLLQVILFKLKRTIIHFLHTRTNYHDKAELYALAEDVMLKCLDLYKESYQAKFNTFYTRCLENALINFVTANKKQVLSLDFEYTKSGSSGTNTCMKFQDYLASENTDMINSDSSMLLEEIKVSLDYNEYRVCEVLLQENHTLRYKEIADELGLTLSAIPLILARLRKKFIALDLVDKFEKY